MEKENTASEKLRTARKQAGLTQQQLADTYGIALRTIESWEGSKRTPPDYVLNLLLRCLAIDFPSKSEQSLSVQIEPTYVFTDPYGKPLSDKLAWLVRIEYVAGRVQTIDEYAQDSYGDLVSTTSKRGKLYQCTNIDLDSELPFAFEFRVIKEV